MSFVLLAAPSISGSSADDIDSDHIDIKLSPWMSSSSVSIKQNCSKLSVPSQSSNLESSENIQTDLEKLNQRVNHC